MFDESKHPRDEYGRFTNANGSGVGFGELVPGRGEPYYDEFSDTIKLPDVEIGRSLGAKVLNYNVMDLATGEVFNFVEGSRLQNVEVFCGAGTRARYRKAYKYAHKYGGAPEEWQHVKGIALLDTPEGHRKAEVHWSQHKYYGKYDFFIKGWLE